jgi:hypothetical protein
MSATCAYHPSRDAIGVCVLCRTRVCGECVTKIDGINHCVRCLDARVSSERRVMKASGAERPWVSILLASAWLVVLTGLAWGSLSVLFEGGR